MTDPWDEINKLLGDINHQAPSATKYRRFEARLPELLGVEAKFYTSYVNKAGNMTVRTTQSSRAQSADLIIALIPYSHEYDNSLESARKVSQAKTQSILLLEYRDGEALPWRPRHLLQGRADSIDEHLTAAIREAFDGITVESVVAPTDSTVMPVVAATDDTPAVVPALHIDARTRRMLRNAIASHKAVMLVGPPGTGKSSLVWEVVREVQADPSKYGMTIKRELMTVTADESWTTRELLGGDSVDKKGRIGFAPGYVLQAIQEDKWLLIDETNRADMDRIFGGLLTWLTGDSKEGITVGRLAPDDSTEVRLGWADTPESQSKTEDVGDRNEELIRTVEYMAGDEWRLIGTYNSLDAQRVFRFGLALGRRFAQIPVAPPTPDMFRDMFTERSHDLAISDTHRAELVERVVRLYEIHADSPDTLLGPALFLSLPRSVVAGLTPPTEELVTLLAEAYLICLGPWLSRLSDDTLSGLRTGMSAPEVLGSQWDWVHEQLRHMR